MSSSRTARGHERPAHVALGERLQVEPVLLRGLVEPELARSCLNSIVQNWQRRPVTASPGTARKMTKLSVIATNTVTMANSVRFRK